AGAGARDREGAARTCERAQRFGLGGRALADRRVGGRGTRGLLGLVGNRLCRLDEAGQRGEALVGGLERLLRLTDVVEQVVQIAGAELQRLRREEAVGIVEGRVD